jgi:hypothetical protein
MVSCTSKNHVFGLYLPSNVFLKNMCRTLDLILFSGKIMVAPTLLGASINGPAIILPEDRNSSSFPNVVLLRKHYIMDKVQKHDSF